MCDVTAQLEDSVTGEDLGLLKSEDKVNPGTCVGNQSMHSHCTLTQCRSI